jgi:hypothetical protein
LDKVKLIPTTPNSKICSKCNIEKNVGDFRHGKYGIKNHLFGPRPQCLSCETIYKKSYLDRMKGKRPSKTKEQQIKNREYLKLKKLNDPIYREKCLIRARERTNTEEHRQKARTQRKKWLENPTNRIAKNMRDRMRSALDGSSKKESTLNMTGISFEALKLYLESKFTENMSWENYGTHGWHIDHIIPCNYFDFTKEEHQKICFYYKNLQPMWAKENISKGCKINIDNFESIINEIKTDLNII